MDSYFQWNSSIRRERLLFLIDCGQLLTIDADALLVEGGIQFSHDRQPASGGGRTANEIDDVFVADQELSPPVHADLAKHAMFDLVPLADPGWNGTLKDAVRRGL